MFTVTPLRATSWASAFFETLRGLSKGQASLAPMWLWVGLSLGRLAMGFIGARISSRSILALASAVSLAFFLAALKAPTAGMAFACLALSGLGLGPIWPTILDHSANRLRTHDSRIMAVIILGGSFGGQAQALMGWIAEKHSLPAALGFAASMIACLLLCIALDIVFERMEARRARLSAAPH